VETESIKLNDGNKVYAMKCGKLQAMVMMQEGKAMMIILDEVQYVPGFYRKVFSLTTAMRRGAKISSEGMAITVANGPVKLIFGSCRKEENDFVLGLK